MKTVLVGTYSVAVVGQAWAFNSISTLVYFVYTLSVFLLNGLITLILSDVMLNLASGTRLSAKINGLAGASTSLMLAVGPFLAAPVYSWSTKNMDYPFDASFVFNVVAIMAVALLAMTLVLGDYRRSKISLVAYQ